MGALLALASGCAPAESTPPPEPPPPEGCPAGHRDLGADGCIPAGVPEDGCGAGFVADGSGGCVAVLPAAPCAPGEAAFLGDASCAPLAACGQGTWGDDPPPPGAIFVDPSYAGGSSDGSAARPWLTIATRRPVSG